MAPRLDSDAELDSDSGQREKKKHRHKSRSRSRDRKKSKKHKKEKKRKRKHSESAGETEGEGGATPTRRGGGDGTPPPPTLKLPGIGKYDSEESEGEAPLERRKEYKREGEKEKESEKDKQRERDKDRRGDRKRKKRSRSRTRSRSRNRRSRSRDRREERKEGKEGKEERGKYRREDEPREDNGPDLTEGGTKEVISLSIEETNKLREKLGLKPLNVSDKYNPEEQEDDDPTKEGTLIPGDRDKTRHLPADHWGEKARSTKLREKLVVHKEKRTIESKLAAVRGLADSDSDDDVEKWVQKQKSKVQAKEEAEKRAKTMSELDDEFGVGELVTEKLKQDLGKKYTAKNLSGLRVEHSTEHFGDNETILTLKDADILDDKYEDVLVNVNIMDTERTKKNLDNLKSHAGYQAYDQEEVDQLTGEVRKKGLLYQYNEEIDGLKKDSFTLKGKGEFNLEEDKAKELAKIRQKLKLGAVQTLETPALRLASDYYNDEEMSAFKKPTSKKKKIRKKVLKADDLLKLQNPDTLLPTDFGNTKKKRAARIIDDDELLPDGRLPPEGPNYDDLPVVEDLSGVRIDDDDVYTINSRLSKAKKLKTKQDWNSLERVAQDVVSNQEDEEMRGENDNNDFDLILDQTKEFCRGLGENVYFEGTGLGDGVSEDLLDFEQSLQTDRRNKDAKSKRSSGKMKRGGWEEVGEGEGNADSMDVDEDVEETVRREKVSSNYRPAILEDEALASTGMGAALKMAQQMGYLEKEQTKQKSTGLQSLKAQKYSVEDKTRDYEEDDRKRRGRDRSSYSGPTTSFAEKKGYKPEITLEYLDDSGRALSSKEAFRFLSHKFHGKSSGKIKTEKRQRKIAEDKLMQKMSSTDTPLQTLKKQQEKAKELATPYLVLSGNKQLSRLKK